MKNRFYLLLLTLIPFLGYSQQFAKIFTFAQNNPFNNTEFSTCHELSNSQGYLILAERYTTFRNAMLIKTDTLLNEIWSTSFNFQASPAPYDNISFYDVGELMNGNYFVFGMTGTSNEPYYVVFVIDTAGNVINHVSVHETQIASQVGNYPQIHIGIDSSIIIGFSEYGRYGFYRLDQNLNLLSSGFYYHGNASWGRDCIMLSDTNLLITSEHGLTKCNRNGTVLWSKDYTPGHHFMSVYESPSGSIYVGGISTVNGPATASIAKYDSSGNPVFLHHYTMNNSNSTSGAWNIFPDGNNIMVYSDSVMFVVDTNGYVVGMGRTLNAYNYKYLKPTHSNDFVVAGKLFQDSIGWYAYSIIRFNDTTSSGCLHIRNVTAIPETPVMQNFSPLVPNNEIVMADTFPFTTTTVNVDFDVVNGCPPNPLAVPEYIAQDNLSIYPNPASGEVRLQLGQPQQEFVVYDMMGRMVLTSVSGSDGSTVIDVSAWAEGVYTVVIGDLHETLRFVVKH